MKALLSLLLLLTLLLSACSTLFPNRKISVGEMKQLLALQDVLDGADKIRRSPQWTTLSPIKAKAVRKDWQVLHKAIKRIKAYGQSGKRKRVRVYRWGRSRRRSKRLNPKSQARIKAYIASYHEELEERVGLLFSRQQFALAKLAANGLPPTHPKRRQAFERLAQQLQEKAKRHQRRYPGLSAYYLHAAGTMLQSSQKSQARTLQNRASQIARRLRQHYAYPVQLRINGALQAENQRKLSALIRQRQDAKLGRGDIILSLQSQSPRFRRSQQRGRRSQRYKSGTRMVANSRYESAKRSVRSAQEYVNRSQRVCRTQGSKYNSCKALGSHQRRLREARAKLAKTPRRVRQDVYRNYSYSTTTLTLNTSAQLSLSLRAKQGSPIRRSQRIVSTLSSLGHGSHPTIRLPARPPSPPSQGKGAQTLTTKIAAYVNQQLLSRYITQRSQQHFRKLRQKPGPAAINAYATFLLRFPTATPQHKKLAWQRLQQLSQLDHRTLPR